MKKLIYLPIYLMVFIFAGGCAQAEVMYCPENLPVNETISKPLPEWTVENSSPIYPFERVALYFKHPNEGGSLVPDDPDNKTKITWTLNPKTNGEQYWFACHYQNTDLYLTRALPKETKECVATRIKGSDIEIVCK